MQMNEPIEEKVTAANAAVKWNKKIRTLNDFYYNPFGRGEWDEVDAKAQEKVPLFLVIVGVAFVLASIIFCSFWR